MGAISSIVNTVSDVVSGAVDTVGDIGSKVDDFVNKEIPGGWGTVAAVAGATVGLPVKIGRAHV